MGEWAEARATLSEAPPDVPDEASHAYSRDTAALYVGRIDEAREQLELALRLRPRAGSTWMSLATLVDFALEPELTDRIVANEHLMEQSAPHERAVYQYALGKAHADWGEHASAFADFARGASELKPTMRYSSERDRLMAREDVSGYSAERIAALGRK